MEKESGVNLNFFENFKYPKKESPYLEGYNGVKKEYVGIRELPEMQLHNLKQELERNE